MSKQNNSQIFSQKITITEDFQKIFSPDNFLIPRHYENCVENILIPNGLIQDRVERMHSVKKFEKCSLIF